MTHTDVVPKPAWLVRCFEKNGDRLVFDIILYGVELGWLQQLFGESTDEPMIYCYPVSKEIAEKLEPFATKKIDTDEYACFLERIPDDYKILNK